MKKTRCKLCLRKRVIEQANHENFFAYVHSRRFGGDWSWRRLRLENSPEFTKRRGTGRRSRFGRCPPCFRDKIEAPSAPRRLAADLPIGTQPVSCVGRGKMAALDGGAGK